MAERIIKVGDKEVTIDTSANFALIYNRQFKGSPFDDIIKLATKVSESDTLTVDEDSDEVVVDPSSFDDIDLMMTYRLFWTLAKNADDDIPEPNSYFKQFEVFPVFEVLVEVIYILMESMRTTKKIDDVLKKNKLRLANKKKK